MFETNKYTILDDGFCVDFRLNNGRVTEILYSVEASTTSTIYSLFSLNNGSIVEAEITGEKVNVREYAPNGQVKFQVSQSKGDRLLVDIEERDKGWYYVIGRIVNNSLKTIPYYAISKQFVKVRKLTPSERKLFLSQYKK